MIAKNQLIAEIAVLIIVAAGVSVYALNNHRDQNTSEQTTITVNGSTTVNPIMLIVKEKYELKYPSVTIQISATGSGAGAAAAIAGTAEIAMLSRDLKDSEKSAGLVPHVIGKDGIAIIVNNSVTVTDLTLEQVAKIYSGEYTNWNQVGGTDHAINLIGRESSSGTRGAFEELMTKAYSAFNVSSSMIELGSNNALLTSVETTSYAIGYVSLGIILEAHSSAVHALKIGGVDATIENTVNGTYTLQRDLLLATKGEATGAALALIDWVLSAEGQKIVADQGYIPVSS